MTVGIKIKPVEPVQSTMTQGAVATPVITKPENMVLGEAVKGQILLKEKKNSP